jgi:ribosomal protein RSM22 (predicted rRNA methylase)
MHSSSRRAVESLTRSSFTGFRRSLNTVIPPRRWCPSSVVDTFGTSTEGRFRWNSTRAEKVRGVIPGEFQYSDGDEEDDYDDEDDDGYGSDDETDASLQPWKTLLERPSRAAWRVTDPHPPSALLESFQGVLKAGNRTPKQLKRAHRKVLEKHTNLAEFRERERRRLVNGKYYRGNEASDEDSIQPVFYGYDETLATLKHRMFPNYAIARRVLEECQSLVGPTMAPKRVLDFGIGCGSASMAALDIFRDSVEWVHGIDPAQPMRECSQRLLEGMAEKDDHPGMPRITFSTGLSTDSSANTSGQGSFDLALFAYSATDLPDVTSTLAAAALLFQKLKPNGIFVMIEPGTPDGFNSIRSVRNMLLDCCPPNDAEFEWEERCHIIAPCTHNGPCPMVRHKKDFVKKQKLAYDLPQELEPTKTSSPDAIVEVDGVRPGKDYFEEDAEFIEMSSNPGNMSEFDAFNSSFCSFVQTIPGSDSRKGEKFSYLVAQKKIYGREEEGESSKSAFGEVDNLSKLLAMAQSAAAEKDSDAAEQIFAQVQDLESRYLNSDEDDLGLELLRGETKRGAMGRIVRAPIKKKGHVYIDYCAAPGRIIRSRVAKSSANVAPGMWNAARKSRWGGLWPDTMDKVYFPTK